MARLKWAYPGCCNIAHIVSPLREGRDRERGWRDELEANDLPEGPRALGDHSYEGGIGAAEELLPQGRPDALGALGDLMAIGALRTLERADLHVPQDVSLIGFDNAEFARLVQPSLSTVQQPGYLMGKKAAELVLRHLSGKDSTIVFLYPTVLERESTASRASAPDET